MTKYTGTILDNILGENIGHSGDCGLTGSSSIHILTVKVISQSVTASEWIYYQITSGWRLYIINGHNQGDQQLEEEYETTVYLNCVV